uniref:UPF0585 protein C16orf13 n=1 Tax=Lygus hesperus TaxID=30085 RepID=A0A0A9Y822_LYGHE
MSWKLCHPAAERNKQPILEILKRYLKGSKPEKLLEISSGSGQHIAYIAPHFPNVTFQPTEFDERDFRSIQGYINDDRLQNVAQPQFLDVRTPCSTWLNGSMKPNSYDYVLNINMMHISEFLCTQGLFSGCSEILKPGGLLLTYGPYAVDGVITPESNVRFDQSLRSQDPSWGLRDISKELQPLALKYDIHLKQSHDLPANNKLLVWQKAI